MMIVLKINKCKNKKVMKIREKLIYYFPNNFILIILKI